MSIVKPPALRAGGVVAVVAPGGPVDGAQLARGVAELERRGYRVRAPALPSTPHRLFSAPDRARLEAVLAALEDPEVRAIWWARGGYGSNRLLPELPADRFRANPKLHVGFSDATCFLQFLADTVGLAALHGPMIAHDLGAEPPDCAAIDHVLAIAGGSMDWRIAVPRILQRGSVEAPMRGGCLSVLASLVGTPWAPRFAGSIALLEDVNERPQRRLDRLLWQLRHSGALDGVRGIVFGEMPGCGEADEICATIAECLDGIDVPIGFAAPIGHAVRNWAVPIGVRVRLVLEGATESGSEIGGTAGWIAGAESLVAAE